MNPFKRIRGDYCINCNSKKSIECYDIYDKPINYSLLIDTYKLNKNILNELNKSLSYMMCKKCKKRYKIDWRKKFPLPLREDRFIKDFLYNNYKRS